MTKESKYTSNPKQWVDNYADELFRFCISRVKNREIAEDLVQDTFLSGLNAAATFRGDCHEKSWLYNILRNKIIDHYRKKTNQEIKQSSLIEDGENDDAFYHRFFMKDGYWAGNWKKEARPDNWGDSAFHKLEKEEFMEFLLLCMSLLPVTWSKVFSLKNIEEFTTKEVCKELNITPSNVWTIIHRAKLQLRGCLEKRWKEK